ncbi:putative f-box domain protein [Phaeoacremonium minimum UCRPA7]|uniref:Putative f-box domain protein n=1 Tax=Phaeoacremonium minimum (strain UCR-PA7) TaxID=1286976 RepID=R8BBU6_PHAM7|nr:putative f-box domain protein [Phaeoacremonium minimum UCRPA7]EON96776.1 putative f-box domain protein [Phaeoacremonium minimum UCRPA7]
MDIIHLPHDLFLLIIAHLCPRDAICCRGVSRKWRHAFTNSELSLTLLRWHFPRCRELRLAASAASFRAAAAAGELGVPTTDELDVELQLELERAAGGDRDWAPVFAEVARRYHHLRTATPAATERIDIQKSQWRFFGVGTWNRYLRLDDKTAPFHYADPRWAYSQEDGVLVYQSVPPPEDDKLPGDGIMATGGRRPRNDAAAATHGYINDTDMTDRFFSAHTSTHYALYVWQPNRSPWGEDDPIELLTIWDISSPSSYKPSEDPSGRQRPDDLILNISLSGIHPQPAPVPANSTKDAGCGPRLIRRMTWRDLEFYGIRQRTTPKLRGLSLDYHNVYIVEEEHRWAQGQHSSLSPPRVHQVKSTAIPVIPGPPRGVTERSSPPSPDKTEFAPEQEDDDAEEPATRLHPLSQAQRAPAATDSDDGATATSSLSAASVAGSAHSNHINGVHHRPLPPPVEGPRWVDECGADGDVNMSFCWRAQVLSTARTPDGMAATAIPLVREQSLWSRSRGAQRARASVETESAVRASPSRWPGWAPCWRHEDFPYLTVSEMVDFGAGVRVTARHCFMLETLSVHVRPAICVKGVVGGGEGEGDDDDDDNDNDGGEEISANPVERLAKLRGRMMAQLHRSRASGSAPADQDGRDKRPLGKGGPRGQEVQFADEMWDELLGKGFICGDERWIIGEDKDGRITIVRF